MSATPTIRSASAFESLRAFRTFVLVNPTDEELRPCYDMVIMIIPPRDKVSTARGDNFCAYKDPATGKPVPGTLVVKDFQYEDGRLWDAAHAIRERLGIVERNGKFFYESGWGAKGVSVLLGGCSLEEIHTVMAAGLERYKAFSLEAALQAIKTFEDTQQRRRLARLDPIDPSQDESYNRNMEIIKVLRDGQKSELLQKFKLDVPEKVPSASAQPIRK